MNRLRRPFNFISHPLARCAGVMLLLASAAVTVTMAAGERADWKYRQSVELNTAGLVRMPLPIDALDGARPDLADLRLVDATGQEIPYVVQYPRPTASTHRPAKSFQVQLQAKATLVEIESGLTSPINGLELFTPANDFIKPVRVEGSSDRKTWRVLGEGQPVFRQSNGASQLYLPLPNEPWPFLRLTIDDHRSQPIPIMGVTIHGVDGKPAPTETITAQITDRTEANGQTRLTLDFGAANLALAQLTIETPDSIFMRRVTLAGREVQENILRERTLATGTIYRLAIDGQPPVARLEIPVNLQTPDREVLLIIQNEDNPPLTITSVKARQSSAFLIFYVKQTGRFNLYSGNPLAGPPHYDLAGLTIDANRTAPANATLSARSPNPDYRTPEVLPGVASLGAALDVAAWPYRKPIKLDQPGVQQLELDLPTLAHVDSSLADLRLINTGHQIPFLIERTSLIRSIPSKATTMDDPKKPKLSLRSLPLPERNLPLLELRCTVPSALFERRVTLFEESTNDRGEKIRRILGEATWIKRPGSATKLFSIPLTQIPSSQTVLLEINNEDNAAIEMSDFTFTYPATRLLFKAETEQPTWLYYGNHQANFPQYDLRLAGAEMLAAKKFKATLQPEEKLTAEKKPALPANSGGLIFWAVLGLVVVVLLVLIARLLPKLPTENATK